jgi:hypothetical protein
MTGSDPCRKLDLNIAAPFGEMAASAAFQRAKRIEHLEPWSDDRSDEVPAVFGSRHRG